MDARDSIACLACEFHSSRPGFMHGLVHIQMGVERNRSSQRRDLVGQGSGPSDSECEGWRAGGRDEQEERKQGPL
eukprot:749760-Hanusia_phi.AAC.3